MSTVIWYKGKLYSDSRVTNDLLNTETGDLVDRIIGKGKKLFRHPKKNKIYGVTGTLEGFADFKSRGYKGSLRWGTESSSKTLVIEWDGEHLIGWVYKEKYIKWLRIYISKFVKTKYNWKDAPEFKISMGSGTEYASEMLDYGCSIREAIQYASDRDEYTDDEVVTLELE